MTGGKVYIGYDHIPTVKSDADFCFLPDSSLYWRYYIVGRIQNWVWGPWSVGTGRHIFGHSADGEFILYDGHEL